MGSWLLSDDRYSTPGSRRTAASLVRKRLKSGELPGEEELRLLWPSERRWLELGGVELWKRKWEETQLRRRAGQYGDQRRPPLPSLTELRAKLRPLFQRYAHQIEAVPELEDRRTMAAAFLAMVETAPTRGEILRCLKQVQQVFGHVESKTVHEDGAGKVLLEEVRERLKRLREGGWSRRHAESREVGVDAGLEATPALGGGSAAAVVLRGSCAGGEVADGGGRGSFPAGEVGPRGA